jgi:glutathione S-transferase
MELVGMSFSPYSERAKWALDHHRVPFSWREHVPLLGEVALRARLGVWRGRVSVPVAFDGELVLKDSVDIARHAEQNGRGAPLFADETAALSWAERGTTGLNASRVTLLARILEDREALRDSVPAWIPRALRTSALPAAASSIAFLQRKYATREMSHDRARSTVREILSALRTALGGRETILSSFSFADIAMATLLQMVSPVSNDYVVLRKAARRAWTDAELAREFSDLVEWRDQLYAKHRRSNQGS